MDAVTTVPTPGNEPVLGYRAGSTERAALEVALGALAAEPTELHACVGGVWRPGRGAAYEVRAPHRHDLLLGTGAGADESDASDAIDAAMAAAPAWREMAFDDRAAILLRAADLLSGPWRARLNAATMLGQSKTAVQAEIDAACELADFWRFNVSFARGILAEQPALNSPGIWNRLDHRPLEGFVYAITPFNFTAIAGNLPTAPALMGNVVLWKPSPTQQLAAQLTMRLLEAAGLPPGVINLLPGDGVAVSKVALASPHFTGLHFTGSTATFQSLWTQIGNAIGGYRSYPRIVGETGGKDFVVAHASADIDVLRTALIRGAFEYQGQKCSAASRAYVPASVWARLEDSLLAEVSEIAVGDVTDPANFMGAVIDGRSFKRNADALDRVAATASLDLLTGGVDGTDGFFVKPSIVLGTDPLDDIFRTEYFGPILAIHVYPDGEFERTLDLIDRTSSYALTGAVIADDRAASATATKALRFAAGNFYVNDKPTGAVVGQQPFGGGRASGTNDKAGAPYNLLRWTSPRTIKENFVPPTDWRYAR